MRSADKTRTGLARRLRRNSTNAELRLWNRLRSRALGYKFVRQEPIGPYVVDFICRRNVWSSKWMEASTPTVLPIVNEMTG